MHQVKDNGDDYVDIATLDVYVNDPVILKDFFFLNIWKWEKNSSF